MRCALCGDFLKYAAGMQCSDCKYTCHKKCYQKVVTKCITQSNAETDPDEAKLNHRIPHRFEPFANMGANWCCHCGYVLPFGKKQCRKCSGKEHRLVGKSSADKYCRVRLNVPRPMRPFRARFLRHVHGGCQPDSVRDKEHEEAPDVLDLLHEFKNAATQHWPTVGAALVSSLVCSSGSNKPRKALVHEGFGVSGWRPVGCQDFLRCCPDVANPATAADFSPHPVFGRCSERSSYSTWAESSRRWALPKIFDRLPAVFSFTVIRWLSTVIAAGSISTGVFVQPCRLCTGQWLPCRHFTPATATAAAATR